MPSITWIGFSGQFVPPSPCGAACDDLLQLTPNNKINIHAPATILQFFFVSLLLIILISYYFFIVLLHTFFTEDSRIMKNLGARSEVSSFARNWIVWHVPYPDTFQTRTFLRWTGGLTGASSGVQFSAACGAYNRYL
jgi:hypothetical protein